MSLTCRACGFENAVEAHFCSSCGAALAEVSAPRKERKFATALFADIVGSTALGEHEDPEIVQSLVGRAIDTTGVITLRHNSRLHHIGLGRRLAGMRVLALVDGLRIRVLTEDGEVIRELKLDPSRDYQPHGRT